MQTYRDEKLCIDHKSYYGLKVVSLDHVPCTPHLFNVEKLRIGPGDMHGYSHNSYIHQRRLFMVFTESGFHNFASSAGLMGGGGGGRCIHIAIYNKHAIYTALIGVDDQFTHYT